MDDANVDDANGICFPYDVLLNVLCRLPGRPLAKSRLVCRAWRAMVDAHSLLLPHVFPRQFPGVFTQYYGYWADFDFFARPSSRRRHLRLPAESDEPIFSCPVSYGWVRILQHCNGLLLLRDHHPQFNHVYNIYVCNPATNRVDRLPPTPWRYDAKSAFLAFDPAVSRHHRVFLLWVQSEEEPWWVNAESSYLQGLYRENETQLSSRQEMEEEPTRNLLYASVFSSRTGQWESRQFMPGHYSSPGRLYDLVTQARGAAQRIWWSAEYWRGSLYIHCHGGVLVILRCSQTTYDTIQLPTDFDREEEIKYTWTLPKRCVLANYERGVHYVVLNDELQLRLWALTESSHGKKIGWTMAHKADLTPYHHVLDSANIQPEMRWEVVECCKRDLRGSLMHREMMKNRKAASLLKYNDDGVILISNKVEETLEEEDNYVESEELLEGSRQSWDTNEDSIVGVDGSTANALGPEEDSDDEPTSEYSWNSDEHNFIDTNESLVPEEENGNEDEDIYDEEDIQSVEFSDGLGSECRIVGFHPHKNVLILHLSNVGVAYHLETSRMQYLGNMFSKHIEKQTRGIHAAFSYRPCFIGALPILNLS